MTFSYTEASLRPQLGMFSLPYGKRYPELVTLLQRIYDDRVAKIAWLPPGWLANVSTLNGGTDAQGNRWVLIPAVSTGALAPAWLDTPAKRAWWDQFSGLANSAVEKYAANDAAAGRAEIAAAYARAAFWDTAYNIAFVLATPFRVAQETIKLASNPFTALGLVALVAFFLLARKRRL